MLPAHASAMGKLEEALTRTHAIADGARAFPSRGGFESEPDGV